MRFSHFFLPHPHTHQKAHLISWQALLVYAALFILLQIGINIYSNLRPGVLGISSKVDQQELIKLTNIQREKFGLPALKENSKLNEAAQKKGENMFEENYWAHYSPSGKDPWGFIAKAGYNFAYAGENLARNFYTSGDVVDAWMASPTHKENIVNSKYQEIGMAVLEGVLNGQKTILVVQEFGTPVDYIAKGPVNIAKTESISTQAAVTGQATDAGLVPIAGVSDTKIAQTKPTVDPFLVTKTLGFFVLTMVAMLLMLDFYILKKRSVVRLSSRHIPHWALMGIAAGALANLQPGSIL